MGHVQLVLHMPEGGEPRPVGHVFLLVRSPVLRQEAIAIADDFSVKIGRELRPILSQALDAEVAAEEGG